MKVDDNALKGMDPDFLEWFKENQEFWSAFCVISDRVRAYYGHWCARAAVDVLRYEKMVQGKDGEFKISNGRTPHLARLYNRIVGYQFFKEKKLKKEKRMHHENVQTTHEGSIP